MIYGQERKKEKLVQTHWELVRWSWRKKPECLVGVAERGGGHGMGRAPSLFGASFAQGLCIQRAGVRRHRCSLLSRRGAQVLGRPTALVVSPDMDRPRAAITNHRRELLILGLAKGKLTVVDSCAHEEGIQDLAWSPCGRWLAYSIATSASTSVIKVCDAPRNRHWMLGTYTHTRVRAHVWNSSVRQGRTLGRWFAVVVGMQVC